MGMNVSPMKFPLDKWTSLLDFLLFQRITSFDILKYLLTDRNWSFNSLRDNLLFVELQVHDVEVVASIDCAHNGNTINKVMCKLMSVTLHDPIYNTWRKSFDKLRYLIWIWTLNGLWSCICPNAICLICGAVVSQMTKQHNRISSSLFQLFAFLNNKRSVVEEMVGWKLAFEVPSNWCLCRNQTNHSYL